MSKKLCPWSNMAEGVTNESSTSSSGLTIRNGMTGWKNHLTTFSVGGLEKFGEFHQKNPDAPRDYRLTDA